MVIPIASADAALLTQTQSFTLEDQFVAQNLSAQTFKEALNVSKTFAFNRFDSTLGTLTDISVTLTSHFTGAVAGSINGTGAVQSINNEMFGRLILGAGDITTVGGSLGFAGVCNKDPFLCFVYKPFDQDFSSTKAPINAGDYVGAGTVDIATSLYIPVVATVSGSAIFGLAGNVTWNGNVTVTYSYDEAPVGVPEPASAMLLLSGLAGLAGEGAVRLATANRRRKAVRGKSGTNTVV